MRYTALRVDLFPLLQTYRYVHPITRLTCSADVLAGGWPPPALLLPLLGLPARRRSGGGNSHAIEAEVFATSTSVATRARKTRAQQVKNGSYG
jgi:hypothetical protein